MKRPSFFIGSPDAERLLRFFADLGWAVDGAVVRAPGGRAFAVEQAEAPPRLEVALGLPDPLDVDEVLAIVDDVGGIVMEPAQETVVGGWGGSFNDPDGNTWELGAPETVTWASLHLAGLRPPTNSPIVALKVPRAAPAR